MMNETFRQSPGGNTNHSVLIGTGLGAAEQNIMNRLSSHHLCWASAPFRGHMTAAEQSRNSGILLPLVYGELLAFSVVLYRQNDTSHTHRMSADCYFTCHITLIFLEMISGYLEKNSVILL